MAKLNAYHVEVNKFKNFKVNSNNLLEKMYSLLDCNMVQAIDVKSSDGDLLTLWVDEEALLKREMMKPRFEIRGLIAPIIGNFVVTGKPDDEGNTTSAPDNLDQFSFIDKKGAIIGFRR
jgi:hypothetical protein